MCYVLDASAFIHGRDARLFKGALYTTPEVVQELRDPASQAMVEILGVVVVEADGRRVAELREKFRDLSPADISVLALALERRCILVTDDSKLAAAAKKLGVGVEKIFYKKK